MNSYISPSIRPVGGSDPAVTPQLIYIAAVAILVWTYAGVYSIAAAANSVYAALAVYTYIAYK
ncbi:MAG: hypothetical protein AB1743_05955 [Actinomycetota bacterium]